MMLLSHLFIITTAAIVGICSQEVTKLSATVGSFISIPCLYNSQYINNEKYLCLCKTYVWNSCKLVTTDQPTGSKKYSILDDKLQHVFSVTVRNLTDEDTCFLCGISKQWLDIRHKVNLHITSGVPYLNVDKQNITAVLGGSVTVSCRYKKKNQFKWCKFGNECISTSGKMNGMKVSIITTKNAASVTMRGLKQENSGWYFCQNDGFQMPVNITVLREVTPASTTTTPNVTSATHLSTAEPAISTKATSTDLSTNLSTAVTEHDLLQPNHSPTLVLPIAITSSLVLLVIFVIGGVAAWKIRSRKSIPAGSDAAETVKDQDVVYSDITHSQQSSNTSRNQPPEVSVIYSTTVTHSTSQQMTEPPEGNVIYSTVSK